MRFYYPGVMPMSKDRFYINFYLKDWVIDTQMLSTLQKGAYWVLLTNMYLNEEGIIYEKHIPNLLQLKVKNLNDVMEVLKPYLIKVSDNPITYTQKKVQSTIKELNAKSKINSINGKLGMKKRWRSNHNKTVANKQTNNNEPYNHAITNSLQTNKQTIDNKQYTYIDKYSSLTEEQRKEKERLKFNSDLINNNI